MSDLRVQPEPEARWTADPPRGGGYYWHRSPSHRPRVVAVWGVRLSGDPVRPVSVLLCECGSVGALSYSIDAGDRWCGPLPVPGEPVAEGGGR